MNSLPYFSSKFFPHGVLRALKFPFACVIRGFQHIGNFCSLLSTELFQKPFCRINSLIFEYTQVGSKENAFNPLVTDAIIVVALEGVE